MHDHGRRLVFLVALMATARLAGPPPANAAATCEKQVNAVTSRYAKALLAKAVSACKKAPGASCFTVTVPPKLVPAGKKLKKCDATAIAALFDGRCPSRDRSCVPAALTTADEVAQCIKCSSTREVECLLAAAFASSHLPSGCAGSPSGAFLDPEDDLFAQPDPTTAR